MVTPFQCSCGATIPVSVPSGQAEATCPACGKKITTQAPALDVFVSYAHEDAKIATAAVHVLESRGLRCWIAPRDMLPGTTWGGAIVQAIEQTRVMVLVFSSESNQSDHVLREVKQAVGRGNPILPFRIENVSPGKDLDYFITVSHWLDAFDGPMEAALDKLADSVLVLLQRDENIMQARNRSNASRSIAKKRSLVRFSLFSLGTVGLILAAIFAGLQWVPNQSGPANLPVNPPPVKSGQQLAAEKAKADAEAERAIAEKQPPGRLKLFNEGKALVAEGDEALKDGGYSTALAKYNGAKMKFINSKAPLPPPPQSILLARNDVAQARAAALAVHGNVELPAIWTEAEEKLIAAENRASHEDYDAAMKLYKEAVAIYQKIKVLTEI